MPEQESEHCASPRVHLCQTSLSMHLPCLLQNRHSGWGSLEVEYFLLTASFQPIPALHFSSGCPVSPSPTPREKGVARGGLQVLLPAPGLALSEDRERANRATGGERHGPVRGSVEELGFFTPISHRVG